jgi:hypothetical protein
MKKKMTLAEFRSAGGKARAKSLSPARRSEIARMAGKNRWKNKSKKSEKIACKDVKFVQ